MQNKKLSRADKKSERRQTIVKEHTVALCRSSVNLLDAVARTPYVWLLQLGILFALALVLSGCSTAAQIRELEYQRLVTTRNALVIQRDQLASEPNPMANHEAELFIGESGLNKILLGASQYEFSIPDVKNVKFRVTRAELDFRNAVAELKLDIHAQHVKYGFEVALESLTELHVVKSEANPTEAQLRIHVLRMVPVAKWNFFKFRFGLFVQRLLRIEAAKFAAQMPAMSFPLRHELPYGLEPLDIDIEIGDAVAHGPLGTPSVSGTFSGSIDRWYLLSDGLHVFLRIAL